MCGNARGVSLIDAVVRQSESAQQAGCKLVWRLFMGSDDEFKVVLVALPRGCRAPSRCVVVAPPRVCRSAS